jgi:hypothetical protein
MANYLLILKATFECGPHRGSRTNEVKITCDPDRLPDELSKAKAAYKARMKRVADAVPFDEADEAVDLASVEVVQVIPL